MSLSFDGTSRGLGDGVGARFDYGGSRYAMVCAACDDIGLGVRTVFAAPMVYKVAVMRFSQARRVSAGVW